MTDELAGTVGAHGPDGGWVVLDDGTRRTYPAGAVAAQVRVLHPGQRVRLRVGAGEDGEVRAVTLAGLPLPG